MLILAFCPSFCPHKLRHFIPEETGPFFSLPQREGRMRGGRWRRGRQERRGGGEDREREVEIKQKLKTLMR